MIRITVFISTLLNTEAVVYRSDVCLYVCITTHEPAEWSLEIR